MCYSRHKICGEWAKRKSRGVGICIYYRDQKGQLFLLLGLERYGDYKNQFNICAGTYEKTIDRGCLFRTLRRELSEEFKIDFSNFAEFCYWLAESSVLKYVNGTPVFYKEYYHKSSLVKINLQLKEIASDEDVPEYEKEMKELDWILYKPKEYQYLKENTEVNVSKFVKSILLNFPK